VDENDADVERAKDRNIEKDVGEIFVSDDGAVDAEDERFFAKARNVLQDAPQISWFQFSAGRRLGRAVANR
jgi:hypothetical protein